MKHILLGFLVVSGMFLMFSNKSNSEVIQKVPINRVKTWFNHELGQCKLSLALLNESIETGKSKEKIKVLYEEARVPFKRVEFLIAYIDPQLYNTFINGAPLPKLMKKVPDVTIIEPRGFQRLDELIYEDVLNAEELTQITSALVESLKGYSEQRINFELTDPVFFEALRYGILRANTMGVTGFDCPGSTDKALREVAFTIEGMKYAMASYAEYYEKSKYFKWTETCALGKELLLSSSFDKFNRIRFHKEIALPLWQQSLALQKHVNIELPNQRDSYPKPINYESKNLYSDSFLNATFFGEHINEEKDERRIGLGKFLFFDPVLSINNERACASCHLPKKGFTDGRKTSLMIGEKEVGKRNAPTLLNTIFSERFFHDLRADRLTTQVDHVVFNPGEFDSDYNKMIEKIRMSEEYRKLFADAYGKEGISRNTITNAITRYVASLQSYNSEFDRYMRGELDKLDKSVIRGFNLFSGKAGCATCHFAPTFAGLVPPNFQESESEVLGVPKEFSEPYVLDDDMGRYMNKILKEQAPFYRRSFKTPTIRNIDLTGPYMHNGAFETLEDVIEFYNNGGGEGLGLEVPYQTLPADSLGLNRREQKDLIRFMKSLSDTTGLTSIPNRLPEIEGLPNLSTRPIGGRY